MENVIGLIYRFGKNDYQMSIMDFDRDDQEVLMALMDKYSEKCSCERGDENLTIKAANVEYWEKDWGKQDLKDKQKELATKLYTVGMIDTNILYDHQTDEDDQMSIPRIIEALNNPSDTAYLLETFAQFCDGSQEDDDHKKFFECMMDIIYYMEDIKKGDWARRI